MDFHAWFLISLLLDYYSICLLGSGTTESSDACCRIILAYLHETTHAKIDCIPAPTTTLLGCAAGFPWMNAALTLSAKPYRWGNLANY